MFKKLNLFLALTICACILCNISADEPKVKTGFLTTSKGRIFYRIAGYDKSGVPLIVLHGGPAYPHNYLQTLDSLSDKRPVIYYDQMGCGQSDRKLAKDNWTIDYYVSELAEIINLLKLKEFHLFGHSWGTIISEEYILKEKPQGLKKVIMSGTFISGRRWRRDADDNIAKLPQKYRTAIALAVQTDNYDTPSFKEADDYYATQYGRRHGKPECMKMSDKTMNNDIYVYMNGPSEFTTAKGTLSSYEGTEKAEDITNPVLFICGDHDESSPKSNIEFCTYFKNSQLLVVPDAGHSSHLDNPQVVHAAIDTFLSK